MIVLAITFFTLHLFCTCAQVFEEGKGAQVIYKWTKLDYKWLNNDDRQNSIRNQSFIVENNIIAGIKVFQGHVYVTVPRWRQGVPSTLNEVVLNSKGEPVLKPFPNWSMQELGNCDAFQYVQSMEIDPNTGYMWIIDTGRTNTFSPSGGTSRCNAKIVIFDIGSNRIVRKHTFPDNVVSRTRNFLNDLVIDYVNGKAKFAYISNTGNDPKLVVYDFSEDRSYFFQHTSMSPMYGYTEIIVDSNIRWNATTPIDGIAMSPDFKYVYYCTLADKNLYRIPTKILRNNGNFSTAVQLVGQKSSQSDGLVFSQKSLYMSTLTTNMVYKHDYYDVQQVVNFQTNIRPLFSRMLTSLEWVDTFSIDEKGNLWFVANRLLRFISSQMDFSNNNVTNMYIWKVSIDENGYLWDAKRRTVDTNKGSVATVLSKILAIIAVIITFMCR